MITLNSSDYENLEDCLGEIQRDFHIQFKQYEFEQVSNIHELIDLIISKIGLEHTGKCTKQQAFYKLRNAIAEVKQLDPKTIHPQTQLTELFDKTNLRSETEAFEEKLGFKTGMLGLSAFTRALLVAFFTGSLALFAYDY